MDGWTLLYIRSHAAGAGKGSKRERKGGGGEEERDRERERQKEREREKRGSRYPEAWAQIWHMASSAFFRLKQEKSPGQSQGVGEWILFLDGRNHRTTLWRG